MFIMVKIRIEAIKDEKKKQIRLGNNKMIKRFKYKEIELKVKTNFLKNGKLYFPKDIQGRLEYNYRELFFERPATEEQKLITIWKALQSEGIKVYNIQTGNLIYEGTTMTEMEYNNLK